MKKLIILIIGIVTAVPAFCQQPDEAGSVLHRIWPEIELIQPQAGKPYKVLLRKDHALYAENIPDSTWVTICYGCGQQPVAQIDTVDANPSTMTFSADWQRKGEPPLRDPWYGGTINYSTTGEAKYSCLQCTGIEIWGERGPGHGTGSVQVGDETKVVSWTGASYVLPVKIVEFKGLPKNDYEVIIKPVSGDITLDFLIVTK